LPGPQISGKTLKMEQAYFKGGLLWLTKHSQVQAVATV